MAAYINTGVYLRILSDELRYNLEAQLKENGHADISPSHGWIFYNTEEGGRNCGNIRKIPFNNDNVDWLNTSLNNLQPLEVNTSGQQVIPGWPFFYYI